VLHAARERNIKASIVKDTLIVNGNRYKHNTLNRLPDALKPKTLASKETKDAIFFWGKDSPMSNFNTDFSFTVDSIEFSSSEQFYNYQKAKFFQDTVACERILNTQEPLKQKKIRVAGYNYNEWSQVCDNHMKEGITHKILQNEPLKNFLKQTGKKLLVETNPFDNYWGIAMRMSDKNITDKSKWGRNRLGQILMEVREMIMND
jgi:hypothetical protein